MEAGFKLVEAGTRARWLGCAVVALVTIAHVFAVAHGVLTIDMARDLYWAFEIAQGRSFPLFGPPVGSFEVLGPVWFYVAAIAAKLSSSMGAYFALLGALAALKYWMVWRVGLRWLDARFALLLVVACALPGIGTYQFVGVGHPQFLELTIWACALFVLRLRANPASGGDAVATGLFAALALHAHPTAILLLPWVELGLCGLPRAERLRAHAWAALGAALPFLPRVAVWLFPALGQVAADNAPAVSGLGGSFAGSIAILQNLLWYQPLYVAKTLITARENAVLAWQLLWTGLLLVTALGVVAGFRSRTTRWLIAASGFTLIGAAVLVAMLRNHTPFYMLYALLPPLTMLLASAWYALQRTFPRTATPLTAVLAVAVLAAFAETVHGSIAIARHGLVASYLPLHSNMQDLSTTLHVESVHSVRQRDAVAHWLCSRPQRPGSGIALHGDLAVAVDTGVGLDYQFACPPAPPQVRIGGAGEAWLGMPVAAWRAAGIAPEVSLKSAALSPVSRVVAPLDALPAISGRSYPPRLASMIAAAQRDVWQTSFAAASDDVVVVSSLLPTSSLFTVSAAVAGADVVPVFAAANTSVYRCAACAGGVASWQIAVKGGMPAMTSIVLVGGRGATNAPSARQ